MTTNRIASLCPVRSLPAGGSAAVVKIFRLSLRTQNLELLFSATTAAAGQRRKMAAVSRIAAMKLPIAPQQRQRPSLSPHMRHNGGCSRMCCRFLWRKSRKSVALPVFAAAHYGDNSATIDTY